MNVLTRRQTLWAAGGCLAACRTGAPAPWTVLREAPGVALRSARAFGYAPPGFDGVLPEPSDSPASFPDGISAEAHWSQTVLAFVESYEVGLRTRAVGGRFDVVVASPDIPNIQPRVVEFVLARVVSSGAPPGAIVHALLSRVRLHVAITTTAASFDEIAIEAAQSSRLRVHAAERVRPIATRLGTLTAQYVERRRA